MIYCLQSEIPERFKEYVLNAFIFRAVSKNDSLKTGISPENCSIWELIAFDTINRWNTKNTIKKLLSFQIFSKYFKWFRKFSLKFIKEVKKKSLIWFAQSIAKE